MIESGTVILEKYKIIKKIGQGGMSVVYLAEDINLGKKWTIKEIKKNGKSIEDKVNLKSLIDEANLIKKLDHPFIPRIVDIIDKGNTVFIVRDYIDGEPMDRIIKNFGLQPEKSVIEWAKIICDIFLYLHGRNPKVIYRDMKPANIMLVSDGSLRLIDFGIAHEGVFVNNTCVGTKGFAPPEQFKKEKITDERSDVYSLGMTLYQMMTNINPGGVGFDKNLLASDINPKCSQEFAKIIDKCIQDNPEDRYQNCSELLYALNQITDESKKGNKKFSLVKILPYISVALGSVFLSLALIGQSILPFPESWFSNPIINVKNICLILAVIFYALFGEFRYLSVKKTKSRSAKASIKGNANQYVVPTVSEGSLFDAIQNPEIYNTQNNIKSDNSGNKNNTSSTDDDDFETGGTQLLGYAPEVTEEDDDFETGGTQLLGYAPEVTEEDDDFETGGTQLLQTEKAEKILVGKMDGPLEPVRKSEPKADSTVKVQTNSASKSLFKIIKSEIHLASDEIVI